MSVVKQLQNDFMTRLKVIIRCPVFIEVTLFPRRNLFAKLNVLVQIVSNKLSHAEVYIEKIEYQGFNGKKSSCNL